MKSQIAGGTFNMGKKLPCKNQAFYAFGRSLHVLTQRNKNNWLSVVFFSEVDVTAILLVVAVVVVVVVMVAVAVAVVCIVLNTYM